MAHLVLSQKEQLELRNKAKAELERLETLYEDKEKSKMINDFKEKFSICEIVYKVILEDHQFNKTGKHLNRLKVNMQQAPYALSYAGYDYDRNLLTQLFGGDDHIGRRSVKKLRDALTHSVNHSAVTELQNRERELYGYMDAFLNKIRTFDNTVV